MGDMLPSDPRSPLVRPPSQPEPGWFALRGQTVPAALRHDRAWWSTPTRGRRRTAVIGTWRHRLASSLRPVSSATRPAQSSVRCLPAASGDGRA